MTYLGGSGFKLSEPHRAECWCVDDKDGLVFIVPDGTEYRDKIGRKGTTHSWYRFRCNDPNCPAVALVRWDVLSEFVSGGVRWPKRLERALALIADPDYTHIGQLKDVAGRALSGASTSGGKMTLIHNLDAWVQNAQEIVDRGFNLSADDAGWMEYHLAEALLESETQRDRAVEALRQLCEVAAQYLDTGRGDLDGAIDKARAVLAEQEKQQP